MNARHSPLSQLCLSLVLMMTVIANLRSQQIAIPRIEQMPNHPSPFLMRDWKTVARGYDTLVFDQTRTGTYLPLVWINTNPVNYPNHNSFGLHTVVGTTSPGSAEGINCLPAIVGATLAGVDKSNQNGKNWVLMAEEWFNRRPEQNVYKNHWVDDGGDDWWYETMPNVFFYQMNYLYPGTGDFSNQFTTVADRWLEAIKAMGGRATPWQIPNMDHRGWFLQTMTPYDNSVHEPEAAGALAWILYNVFVKTGDPKYRVGAEWAMEFLNGRTTNPSYELQLSYGAYLAARMNAEIGTTYDLQKMLNWCFDVGPLRSWGAIVGTWGGYDCSGLIGEVNGSNDYAFAMNTFEQIGQLVPMVRYDPRFARAMGKWVLNAANACRLFYPNYLPGGNQDSYSWAQQYDSNSVIGHEAIRQFKGSTTPYATGDAISGGWGNTTLTLYGSSHVGILGGIIDTTDVPMILKLDLLKTDYYHAPAFPSFLFFNPYDSLKSVSFDVGSGQHDIYDAVSKTFIRTNVTGFISLPIPANGARIAVVAPASGALTYVSDRMLIDGIVADYHSGSFVGNDPPRVKSLAVDRTTIARGDTINAYCTAVDRDSDTLSYAWHSSSGKALGNGPNIKWASTDSIGEFTIQCVVSDGKGGIDTAQVLINVVAVINHPPVILQLTALPRKVNLGGATQLHCYAGDADNDSLAYKWTFTNGSVIGNDSVIVWTVPSTAGNFYVHCIIDDNHGGTSSDSLGIEVRDSTLQQSGQLVMYLSFNGNANDATGNNHNGTVHGAQLTTDKNFNPNGAYAFNGTSSYIQVPNAADLNSQQGITVSFWMKVGAFYSREEHPISHGSWQNRWKVSIGNQHLRWTVKTATGTKDLNSPTDLQLNRFYNVTATYDGATMELYLDGYLDAFASWSGPIATTAIDMTIGQVLPTDPNYNFNGVLDEVRLYNYALSYQAIQELASGVTGIDPEPQQNLPRATYLAQNYPNPFNPSTRLEVEIAKQEVASLKIYDVLGREIATLLDHTVLPGRYSISWDASSEPAGVYFARLQTSTYHSTRKLLLIK